MKPIVYFGGLLLAALAGALVVYLMRLAPPAPLPPGPGNGAIICPGDASCPDEAMAVEPNANMEVKGFLFPKNLIAGQKPVLLVCDGGGANGCPPGYVGYLANQDNFELQVQHCDGRAPCRSNYAALYCVVNPADPAKRRACALTPGEYIPHP